MILFRMPRTRDTVERARCTPDQAIPAARLIAIMTAPDGRGGLACWIWTTWLRCIGLVPAERRQAFIAALVTASLARDPSGPDGRIGVPMVRLRVVAVRP